MLVYITIFKIASVNLQEAARVYNITKWIVLVFSILNLALLFVTVFGLKGLAGCSQKRTNSTAGLLAKLLLVVFDIMIFVLRCCNWGIKDQADNEDEERKQHVHYFR
jgi:hypothetical protein